MGSRLLSLLLLALFTPSPDGPDEVPLASFHSLGEQSELPAEWRRMEMPGESRQTRYEAVRVAGRGAVRAFSHNAASGLTRRLDAPVDSLDWISWTWRVERPVEGVDPTTKPGDDHAVRLYVTFEYDPADLGFLDRVKYEALRALGHGDVPLRALCYVWSGSGPADTTYANPYTDWVQMVPVRVGEGELRRWVREERNVRADYQRAFGTEMPPMTGVAIMTDTDNSGQTAVAYYGDITLRSGPQGQERVSPEPSPG